MVENKVVELPGKVEQLPLERFAKVINNRLGGLKVGEITPAILDSLFDDIRMREEYLGDAVKLFFQDLFSSVGQRLYLEGPMRLIRHPEFRDVEKLRDLIDTVETSHVEESGLFYLPATHVGPGVIIGAEHGIRALCDCSSIKFNFQFGDRTVGTIGILGPRRMDYSVFMRLVESTSDLMGHTLEKHLHAR